MVQFHLLIAAKRKKSIGRVCFVVVVVIVLGVSIARTMGL